MKDAIGDHELSEALTEFLLREICELKRKTTVICATGNGSTPEVTASAQASSEGESCGMGAVS